MSACCRWVLTASPVFCYFRRTPTINTCFMNRSVRFLPFIISAFIVLVACQSAGTTPTEKPKDTVAMKADTGVFDHLLVDNRKDPSCGMPVTAGIHDTAHYKGNVLGFCSKECKEGFQKNPELLLAAADIKKK
jgi:YHS domain-containing protein